MTTIHAGQIQFTNMHIRKTTPRQESTVCTVSNVFLTILHTHFFLPQSFVSRHFTTHTYPSHYTPLSPFPTLHFTTLHFTSLHLFTLLDDFHFTSFHYTFKWFSAHFFFKLTSVIAFLTLFFKVFGLHWLMGYGPLNDVVSSWDCTALSDKKPVQSLVVRIGTTRFNIKTSALFHTLYLNVPMILSINSDCLLKMFSVR
jgi:hypothetical protein